MTITELTTMEDTMTTLQIQIIMAQMTMDTETMRRRQSPRTRNIMWTMEMELVGRSKRTPTRH